MVTSVCRMSMPYEYSFARAIGQKVRARNCDKVLTITGIAQYYTDLEDDAGNQYVGTPTTICPAEKYHEGPDNYEGHLIFHRSLRCGSSR